MFVVFVTFPTCYDCLILITCILMFFVVSVEACGVHSDGEDQTGAAGQLYLVWQEEETV